MPKAKETKAHIIEKTASVFNKKGFIGTTLSDMEAATGLTKGSIYNNFANKDDVALAVFDYNLKKVNNLVQTEMDKHHSAKEKLLSYVKIYGKNVSDSPFTSGGCPILNTAVESDDTHPALRKKASNAITNWMNKVADLIEKGIKQKEFRSSINSKETAALIVASIEGAIMISRVTGRPDYLKSIMNSIKKIIENIE
jgi:TetR/AcrR family transcriptional regulator, transcriptional repressor for nem operon